MLMFTGTYINMNCEARKLQLINVRY